MQRVAAKQGSPWEVGGGSICSSGLARIYARAAQMLDEQASEHYRAAPSKSEQQRPKALLLLVPYTASVNVRGVLQIGTGWKTTQSRGRHSLLAIPIEREDDRPRHGRVAEAGDELVARAVGLVDGRPVERLGLSAMRYVACGDDAARGPPLMFCAPSLSFLPPLARR